MKSEIDVFQLPPPLPEAVLRTVAFWATSYFTYEASEQGGNVLLLDMRDRPLGVTVSRRDYCYGAMEGTLVVNGRTYNYAGTRETHYVDCSPYFQNKLGYTRFREAIGPFGDGTDGFVLVPYRTIASDRTCLELGTVLHIPLAVGHSLPGGSQHDGYFFVGDVGGAIKGNHLDVFNGKQDVAFDFVRSQESPLFEAHIIHDGRVREYLRKLHIPNPTRRTDPKGVANS
jgi:3D (Asp-Asp-Asp) domain-containing protein